MTTTSPTPTTSPVGADPLDASRTSIAFTTRHMFGLGGVTGTFALRSGNLVVASPIERWHLTATADAASFSTGKDRRDTHVGSADFLRAEEHPDIAFRSARIEKDGSGLLVHGNWSPAAPPRRCPCA